MSYLDPTYELPEVDEAARLRRIIKMQLAVIVSLLLHIVIVIVLALMPLDERTRLVAKLEPKDETPVPITFMSPLPPRVPAPPPPRRPSAQEPRFTQRTPDPNEIVDPKANYRMEDSDNPPTRSPKSETTRANGARGRKDSRPEGGLAGGELPRPTPGAPSGAPVQDEASEHGGMRSTVPDTPDLAGRLRDFRRAMSQPRPASPTGPKGGGSGDGGADIDIARLPATGFGMGNLEFESRDYDWSSYGKQVYLAIWRAWHNRLYVTTSNFERWAAVRQNWALEHASAVRFVITRKGDVEDIVIETESGCVPLDASAQDALDEVVLPPLPEDFPREQERVHARFMAQGDIRSMRRALEWYRSHGYF